MKNPIIFVVDDEVNIRELLKYNLEKEGYSVRTFSNGQGLLDALVAEKPHLICLDLMLPDIDGLELCKKIRSEVAFHGIPILMLTAKSTEFDTVIGLEAGADDYLAKPFSINEFLARVRAHLRRNNRSESPGEEHLLQDQELILDVKKHRVTFKGNELTLALKEFELLKLLMGNQGRVYRREELLNSIWGYEYYGDTRTVDVHIHSLRKIIGKVRIATVRGIGYKYGG